MLDTLCPFCGHFESERDIYRFHLASSVLQPPFVRFILFGTCFGGRSRHVEVGVVLYVATAVAVAAAAVDAVRVGVDGFDLGNVYVGCVGH